MRNYKLYIASLLSCVLFASAEVSGQLVVNPNQTATVLATKLAGPGINITSPVLTCAGVANGTFVSTATPLGIDSGIILTTGTAVNAAGPESFLANTTNGTAGDASLTSLAGATTYDACILEFDFVPNGDTVSFNYQFGSEEYNHSTCGNYNDAFAFFISGPGISGAQNMALIPGTTIPVTVNSVNSGVPGAGYSLANCTAMGPGAPFTTYFYDNTGGTQLTYKGYTVKLAAVHNVTPCSTYHLKLTIADAGNKQYDSGVFIEAGSLKTNTYAFDHIDSIGATINGTPHSIVKGCSPAIINVVSAHAVGTDQTVHFTFGGSAVSGVDFTGPTSATIAAGDTFTTISIAGLPTPSTGTKTLEIYLESPFSCGGIADSIALNILDSPSAAILTPDTTICLGQSFQISATGTPGLTYSWAPAATLSSATVMEPIATPVSTTVYTMTAILPASGCSPIIHDVTVTVISPTIAILTPDTTVCPGGSVHIFVDGSTFATYSWSPSAGLDNPSIENPTATPTSTTTYSLTATSAGGCPAYAHINITVANPTVTILTPDTAICSGASANIMVNGDAGLTYSWTPGYALSDSTAMQPVATPTVTTTYYMTAIVPGTTCIANGQITVTILPPTIVNAGQDKTVCINNSISFISLPSGSNYSYLWNGPSGFTSTLENPIIGYAQPSNQGSYIITVVDNNTGCAGSDTVNVTVNGESATLTNVTANQTIPYGSSIQLNADNALYYTWKPDNGTLNNPNINNPIATPVDTVTNYIVYGIDAEGCVDSAVVTVTLTYDNIFIPSAFTPNKDGLNDFFHIVSKNYYKLVEMSVFNRWGNMVYHVTNGENTGWDGTYNNQPQDMGVYNYLIILEKPDGQQQVYKGDVTLIR